MALKAKHKSVGSDLTQTEWEAEDSHTIEGEHAQQHSITAVADHTSGATSGKMLKADANGLPIDATNTDAQVAAAVAASHANLHTIVRKTSDQTVNNSNVFVDDSELKMAVAANEIWLVEIFLMLATTAVADFKAQLTCPVGGVVNARQSFPTYALANYVGATTQLTMSTAADLTNAGAMVMCIYVGGANGGTLQLQWAQNQAEATNTKVLTNSVLIAHRIL
jgi:hypothetical protein